MEITKTVPVTIEVDDDDKRDCSGNCCFNVEGRYCARFDATTINGRNDGCLAEFGTGEKPAVVPWKKSKIGDIVEIDDKRYLVHGSSAMPNLCKHCYFAGTGNCPLDNSTRLLCDTHPSGGDVYFTEVKE